MASMLGVGDVQTLSDFAHRTHDRIQFKRASCFDVLKHGRLKGTKLGCDGVSRFWRVRYMAANGLSHGLGFAHSIRAKVAYHRVCEQSVECRASQRADRVHGEVAKQLEPDLVPDVVARLGVKPRRT